MIGDVRPNDDDGRTSRPKCRSRSFGSSRTEPESRPFVTSTGLASTSNASVASSRESSSGAVPPTSAAAADPQNVTRLGTEAPRRRRARIVRTGGERALGLAFSVLFATAALATFYRYSVHHSEHITRRVLPGAVLAVLLWIMVSWAFGLYVRHAEDACGLCRLLRKSHRGCRPARVALAHEPRHLGRSRIQLAARRIARLTAGGSAIKLSSSS